MPASRNGAGRPDSVVPEIGNPLTGLDAALADRLQTETARLHPCIGRHLQRTGIYSAIIARALDWAPERVDMLTRAAALHDVGKLGIAAEIIQKPGRLTEEESKELRRHTLIGHKMLSWGEHPIMKMAASIALSHHERWDGSGYPFNLHGPSVPIESRIVSLVDAYDAMRMRRSYKPAMSHEQAIDTLLNGDGRTSPEHFDPELLEILKDVHPRVALAYSAIQDPAP